MTCTNRFGCHMRHSFLSTFVPLFSLCIDIGSLTPHRFTSQFVFFSSLQHQNGFNSVRCSNLWVFSVFVCLCRLKPSFMAYILFFFAVLFDGGYFGCTHMVYGFQLDCTQQKPYEIKSHAMFPNWITAISLVQLRRVTHTHTRGIVREREAFLELNDQNAKTWKRTIESDERRKNENCK